MSEFGRLEPFIDYLDMLSSPSHRIVLSLQSRCLCLSAQPPTAPLCNHHPRGRSDPFRSHRTHPIPKTGFGPVRSPALVSSLIVGPVLRAGSGLESHRIRDRHTEADGSSSGPPPHKRHGQTLPLASRRPRRSCTTALVA